MAKRHIDMPEHEFKRLREDRRLNRYVVEERVHTISMDKYKSNSVCKRAEIIRDGRKFPSYQKPSLIGVFSLDSDRRFLPDESQIKYLYWNQTLEEHGKVNFDLNEGLKSCVRKNEFLNENLDHIFRWIKHEGSQREECMVSQL